MEVLLACAGLLALSFLVQLVVWRISHPRRQLRTLLVLYTIVPFLASGVAWFLFPELRFSAAEIARILLFYCSLSLAYFVAHCAIDSGSPTLDIVTYVAGSGTLGRSEEELSETFGPASALTGRFALVEHGGMMRADKDVFRLTRAGRFYARLFDDASRVFGLPRGG